MFAPNDRINFTVAQLGNLNRAEAENAVNMASAIQRAFGFDFRPGRFELDINRYALPNGGFDLEAAARETLKDFPWPRPLILLTSAPFSDQDYGKTEDYFFFGGSVDHDNVEIISTYVWDNLPGKRRLQPFLLYQFAQTALEWCTDMGLHDETRGCLFDYCDDPKDIDRAFESGPFCNSCQQDVYSRVRAGVMSIEQLASVKKLFKRTIGQKSCFVVMPFKSELKVVYDAISEVLQGQQWTVTRADEIGRPRRITDAIVEAILTSDLVVADLTESNPNVFYEVGVAHATGCDVILLAQGRTIPFDITTERTIFYKKGPKGLQDLAAGLKRLAGSGRS